MTNDDRELSGRFKAEATASPASARRRPWQGLSALAPLGRGAAVLGVVLLALAVGLGPVSATQAQEAAAATTSSFGPDARYGVVVAQRGALGELELVIRSETDAAPIVTLGSFAATPSVAGRTLAVSPDGRRLAYWTDNQGGSKGNSIRLWDAATPGRTTTLLASPSGETGTGVVWSSDGKGLLLSFVSLGQKPSTTPPPPPPDSAETVLRTLEIGSAQLSQVFHTKRGSLLKSVVPQAWNREGRVIGAVEVGEGGYAIADLVIRDGVTLRTSFDARGLSSVRSVAWSSDAAWVVAVVGDGRTISWSINDPVRVTDSGQPQGGSATSGWIPGSTRVIVRQAAGVQDAALLLWDVATNARTAAGSSRYLAVPRTDGSALYVTDERGSTSVLEITSGAREPMASMPTYLVEGQVFPEGAPIVGVILR